MAVSRCAGRGVVCAVLLLCVPAEAGAATADAALLDRQQALFERTLEAPTDLAAMFEYAMVSIQLEDYEPAISTLERMLLFNEDLPRVKLELGAAYFRLGAYSTADYYFEQVLADDPPPTVRQRVEDFRQAIASRQRENRISGYVSAGVVYSTNANLGPDAREIDAAVLGGTGFLDPDATSDGDLGLRASAVVRHSHALGRDDRDAWVSEAALTTLHFLEETAGDLDVVRLVTGPSLAVGEGLRSARIRPYASFSYVRSGNDPLYLGFGGGAEYSYPVDDRLGLFAGASAEYREYRDGLGEFDATNFGGVLGAAYRAGERTVLRTSLIGDVDLTDTDFTQNYEVGLRGAVEHSYMPGIEGLPDRDWLFSAYAQGSRRWYDATDPDIRPDIDRRDWDISVGLANSVPLTETVSLVGTARYFDRISNIRNFELDSLEIGLDVQVTF